MKILLLTSCLMATLSFSAQQGDQPRAKVRISTEEEMAVVSGEVSNPGPEAQQLKYQLISHKSGKSGKSNNQQGSSLKLKAGETQQLSTTKMNVSSGDSLYVSLVLMNESGDTLMIDNYSKIFP